MMSRRTSIAIGITAGLLLSAWRFRASEPAIVLPVTTAGIEAQVRMGVEDSLGSFVGKRSETTTTYSDGNYGVQITETPSSQSRTVIRLVIQKSSGESFRLNNFSVRARVPRSAIRGIWYPGAEPSATSVMVTNADYPIHDIADANYGIPYVAAASVDSKNVFAMGLGRQDLSVAIEGQPVGNFYEFELKELTSRFADRFEETFYISTDASLGWPDVAADYADWVDVLNDYRPFPISDRALEPLYDTWYWTGDQVDERVYLDTARIASDLGIGLYLADSGWDTEAGEYNKWLAGKTGDYKPPAEKFSNLNQTFSEMRSDDHLGIDLWLQPFAVGRESARYDATRDMHIHVPEHRYAGMGWGGLVQQPLSLPSGDDLENVNLCPRLESTQTYLRNLFTEIATTYKPQGYWLDFMDAMPTYCTAAHSHTYALFGEGFKRSLQTIKDTILIHDPHAIVHFRARYANLNTKSFANIWQSGDSPGDFDRMRLNSIRLRPFSKGVIFAADEMYWPDNTPEQQVAKFVMTSVMVGVPAFGPNTISAPPTTLAILKAWLTFYKTHRSDLTAGKFSTFGQLAMPNHKIESENETFAYIRNLRFSEVPAQTKTIFLMNATNGDRFIGRVRPIEDVTVYSIKVFDRYLVPESHVMLVRVDSQGLLNINVAVEQGGMLLLTALDGTQQKRRRV